MADITSKSLREINSDDLRLFASDGYMEGDQLELKEALSAKGKGNRSWMRGEDRLGARARNELFAELVAFASAHGATCRQRPGGLGAAGGGVHVA
jgi:hypothetical protein